MSTVPGLQRARPAATRAEAIPYVGLLGAAWGSGYLLTELALRGFTPIEISFARLAIGAVVLLALVRADPRERPAGRPRGRRLWLLLVLLAVLSNVLPYTLTAWSITEMPTTAAAITNATTPLFTAALALLLAREARPGPQRIAGILLGFAGVAVMFGLGFAGGAPLARLALIGAAVSYALAFVLATAGALDRFSPIWISAVQLTIAAALTLPPAAVSAALHPPEPTTAALAAVLVLGLVTTGLATIVYYRAVRRVGATSASLATYVVPVVGALLGVVFLGESLGPLVVAGAAVTALGILLAERGPAPLARERLA